MLRHADDARPAWLWSGDGQRLIWSNPASSLFLARLKKHGIKRAEPAMPIKGQVARIIRLGAVGRSSLARIQFRAGEKPASSTCTTTPLAWSNGETALLIVAVDPIDADILDAAPELAQSDWQDDRDAETPSPPIEDDQNGQPDLQRWRDAEAENSTGPAAPDLPALGQAESEPLPDPVSAWDDNDVEEAEPDAAAGPLSALVDRLAADEALFAPLTEKDDIVPPMAPSRPMDDALPEDDVDGREVARLYRVTGRGFSPLPSAASDFEDAKDSIETPPAGPEPSLSEPLDEAAPVDGMVAGTPDEETVERVSRYNFDELSRILSDRVGERGQQPAEGPPPPAPQAAPGALINLGGETLVLNRLPLGILVFRDQQVLFANRAITEMVGHDSAESLRRAGLAAVFPAMDGDGHEAGPVNHLVQRDGTLVPVTARLQSISWQGRPALMLSASTTEVRTGHEDAVRAFAEAFADLRGDGFVQTSRSGAVSAASATAISLLGGGKPMIGKPLSALVDADNTLALRAFLERPARFAETARPSLPLRSADGRADILLFALGQAGIVSGYFALVHARESAAPLRIGGAGDADPALLARISRGVRRPLNTIVGFSDLIGSQAFGAIGNERYEGYAQDIARAGREIAALVDELDDYARLRDGRYLPQRASLDLTEMLENCVLRIRDQANARRVIVRNAISQTLPRVTADRASLAQAVLNLLASAIDQTPTGSAVVISAQLLEDGAIIIHVRDSSAHGVDMAERFVVFRDGMDRDGQALAPIRSSVGLALTRSLLAVNAVSLSVDPAGNEGLLFSLKIPADLVDARNSNEA